MQFAYLCICLFVHASNAVSLRSTYCSCALAVHLYQSEGCTLCAVVQVDREFGSADTNGSKGVDFVEFTAYYERVSLAADFAQTLLALLLHTPSCT